QRNEDNDPHTAAGGGPAHADHRGYRGGQDYDHAPNSSADKTSWRFRDRLRPRTGVRQTLLRPEERRRDPESARQTLPVLGTRGRTPPTLRGEGSGGVPLPAAAGQEG